MRWRECSLLDLGEIVFRISCCSLLARIKHRRGKSKGGRQREIVIIRRVPLLSLHVSEIVQGQKRIMIKIESPPPDTEGTE